MIATDIIAIAIAELKSSQAFLDWKPAGPLPKESDKIDLQPRQSAAERHYTPDELASLWGVSAETVRIIFREEPGVLRISNPGEKKRKYVSMRIPESVASRVHKRLSAVPQVQA